MLKTYEDELKTYTDGNCKEVLEIKRKMTVIHECREIAKVRKGVTLF